MRDPHHPLHVRLDGALHVDRRTPAGTGEAEHPFGESPRLCAPLPSCCFRGPYRWTRTHVVETARLQVSASGYHAAAVEWTVEHRRVSGSVSFTVSVTRERPSGPRTSQRVVTLRHASTATA